MKNQIGIIDLAVKVFWHEYIFGNIGIAKSVEYRAIVDAVSDSRKFFVKRLEETPETLPTKEEIGSFLLALNWYINSPHAKPTSTPALRKRAKKAKEYLEKL